MTTNEVKSINQFHYSFCLQLLAVFSPTFDSDALDNTGHGQATISDEVKRINQFHCYFCLQLISWDVCVCVFVDVFFVTVVVVVCLFVCLFV